MADLSDLEVDLTIQARHRQHHRRPEVPGHAGGVAKNKTFLGKHKQGYHGVVSRLMPTADRSKGAIPVRVKVRVPREEEGVYLKPDMGVMVSFKKVDDDSCGRNRAGPRVHKYFRRGSEQIDVLNDLTSTSSGRVPRPDGSVRLRQDDAPESDSRAGSAERG